MVGYIRVSTSEQADSGLSLDSQRAAIQNHCKQRGWVLVEMVEDAGYSAKNLSRPGMAHALDLLAAGAVGALVVAKLDRATRSVIDAANLLAQGQREGWALVALDLGLDPTSPAGELVATIMAAVAQWERRAIGVRTSDASWRQRRQRGPFWGALWSSQTKWSPASSTPVTLAAHSPESLGNSTAMESQPHTEASVGIQASAIPSLSGSGSLSLKA